MKRIIILAAVAALSLTSCLRDETPAIDLMEDVIGFSPYMERARTKVHVHDVVSYEGPALPWGLQGFQVAAYLHGTADSYFGSEQTATVSAAKSPSGAYYATGNTYFWPTASELDFFAYSSAGAGTISNTSGTASLSFASSTSPADSLYGRDDFVTACVLQASNGGDHSYGSGTSVQALSFGHAMAKVNRLTFRAFSDDATHYYDNDDYRFTVLETKLSGIRSTGTYTFNPADGGQNWSDLSGSFDYTFSNILNEADSSNFFLGDETKSLRVYGYTVGEDGTGSWQWFDDKFILIPQRVTIQVKYKVEREVGSSWVEVMGATTKTASIELYMGKAYNITLSLTNDGDVIVFSAEVDDWDELDSTHYIEGGTDYGPGISCAGVVWAPVNCGIGADNARPYGLLYQWGRKYGQEFQTTKEYSPLVGSLTIEEGNSAAHSNEFSKVYGEGPDHNWWSDSVADSTLWNANGADPDAVPVKTSYDPCPDGWRVPSENEIGQLCSYVIDCENIQIQRDKVWIISIETESGAILKFPENGRIGGGSGGSEVAGAAVVTDNIVYGCYRRGSFSHAGYYWSSGAHSEKIMWDNAEEKSDTIDCFSAKCMWFNETGAKKKLYSVEPFVAHSVRCVQDKSLLR